MTSPQEEGLTYADMARLLKVSPETPRRWALGLRKIPEEIDAEWYFSPKAKKWYKRTQI